MDGHSEEDGAPLLLALRRRASALLTPWSRRRSLLAGGLVLSTLFLERLAFYSLLSNFYIFLTNDGHTSWSSDEALSATLLLTGLAYFSALPAGWLADAVVGRYWTITGGLCLYIVAYAALTTLAFDGLASVGCDKNLAGPWCSFYIYGVVVAIGLAVGTIKANVPAFGAEQVFFVSLI
jgi:solute carrier family 15 (peptide/histidine transporter), member 3/4